MTFLIGTRKGIETSSTPVVGAAIRCGSSSAHKFLWIEEGNAPPVFLPVEFKI